MQEENIITPKALDAADAVIAPPEAAGKKEVPIVFCADENYGLYLPVVVQSIIENSSKNYHYQIIVFDCGIKREVVDALARQISSAENFSFCVWDIKPFIERSKFRTYRYITAAAYGRFFIPELCEKYEKVIYADIDMIFNRDIAELMAVDLGDSYIGAVIEFAAEAARVYHAEDSQIDFNLLGLEASEYYINSGFLLFNIKQWRAHNLTEKCLQFCREATGELLVQNAFNAVCRGQIVYLPPAWNFSIWDNKSIAYWQEKQPSGFVPHLEAFVQAYEVSLKDKHLVAHFLGTEKPWRNSDILFADLWQHYAVLTECHSLPLVSAAPKAQGKKEAPIVFCADANYGQYLPVAVQSIIENASEKYHYEIIVFDCGIEREAVDALARQIRQYDNFSLHVKKIDAWLEQHKEKFVERGYITKATYGRFAIPELCRGYRQVIYADIDMVFNRDVAELMAVDLGDNYIGGVADAVQQYERFSGTKLGRYFTDVLGIGGDDIYINAGLMVFNIAQWRQHDLARQALQFLVGKRLVFLDQDAVNAICKGHIFYLSAVWNSPPYFKEVLARPDTKNIKKQAEFAAFADCVLQTFTAHDAVCHYIGPAKPWLDPAAFLGAAWWEYAAKTPLFGRYFAAYMQKIPKFAASVRPSVKDFKLFGIPILRVKDNKRFRFYNCGFLRLAKLKKGERKSCLYIFGIRTVSCRRLDIQ